MEVGDTLTVEIGHIGSSSTPIAKIPGGGQHNLIVYGGEPGDRVEVSVKKTGSGVFVGELRDPSSAQKARAEEQRAERERKREKRRGGASERTYKYEYKGHEADAEEWKGSNKNSLLNGHL